MLSCQYFKNGTVIHNGRSLLPTTGLLFGAGQVIWPAQPHPAHAMLAKSAIPYDLRGRCISPGFIDNSLSLIKLGEILTTSRDLRQVHSADGLREFLWQHRLKNPSQSAFFGRNLDIREGRPATAADLNRAFPDRPAIIFSKDEKTALVNTHLLTLARLDGDGFVRAGKNTIKNGGPGIGIFQTGQKIFRRAEFENGVLPKALHSQILAVLPRSFQLQNVVSRPREECVESILAAQMMALRLGITCAFEPEITPGWMDIFQEMEQRGLLFMRIRGSFSWGKNAVLSLFERGQKTDWLRVDTIRLNLKGVMFEEDWLEFKDKAWEIHRRGWRISTSAFDTPTLEALLAFFEKMYRTMPIQQSRHRIEHFGCPTEKQLERAAKMSLGIVIKVPHLESPKASVLKFLTEKKPEAWIPMADIFRQPLAVSIASGGPDHALPCPLKTMEAAINGPVLTNFRGKSQSLSRGMALWAHTRLAAIVNGEGDRMGNLELATRPKNPLPFMADFVLLDKNPLDHPPGELTVLATFVDGICRWAHPDLYEEQAWFVPVLRAQPELANQ